MATLPGHRHVGTCTEGPTSTREEIERMLTEELGFAFRMPQAEYIRGGTLGRPPLRGRLCWQPDYCHQDRAGTGTRFWLRLPNSWTTREVWPDLDPHLAVAGIDDAAGLARAAAEGQVRGYCSVCGLWLERESRSVPLLDPGTDRTHRHPEPWRLVAEKPEEDPTTYLHQTAARRRQLRREEAADGA